MSALEELMHAALAAPPQQREAALSVLRGQARGGDSTEWPSVAEPYLTLRETARRLGLSAATLGRWRIPGHGLGGRWRYRLSEVEAYLRSRTFQRRAAALRAERKHRAAGRSATERLDAAPAVPAPVPPLEA